MLTGWRVVVGDYDLSEKNGKPQIALGQAEDWLPAKTSNVERLEHQLGASKRYRER
jgi:hypothetical protein